METKAWRSADNTSIFVQTEIKLAEYSYSKDILEEVTDIIVKKLAQEYLILYQDKIFKKLSIKQIKDMTYKIIAKEIKRRLFDKKEKK